MFRKTIKASSKIVKTVADKVSSPKKKPTLLTNKKFTLELELKSEASEACGLIKLSKNPEKMDAEKLKKLLNNRAAYILYKSEIYYVNRDFIFTKLNISKMPNTIKDIFPKAKDTCVMAENIVLKTITLFIGHAHSVSKKNTLFLTMHNGFFTYEATDIDGGFVEGVITCNDINHEITVTTTIDEIYEDPNACGRIMAIAMEKRICRDHKSEMIASYEQGIANDPVARQQYSEFENDRILESSTLQISCELDESKRRYVEDVISDDLPDYSPPSLDDDIPNDLPPSWDDSLKINTIEVKEEVKEEIKEEVKEEIKEEIKEFPPIDLKEELIFETIPFDEDKTIKQETVTENKQPISPIPLSLFNNPSIQVDKLKQRLLEENKYLSTFMEAHNKKRQNEWFQCARRTELTGNEKLEAVLEHAFKNNRSKQVLIDLSWMNSDGIITETAPQVVKNCYLRVKLKQHSALLEPEKEKLNINI